MPLRQSEMTPQLLLQQAAVAGLVMQPGTGLDFLSFLLSSQISAVGIPWE